MPELRPSYSLPHKHQQRTATRQQALQQLGNLLLAHINRPRQHVIRYRHSAVSRARLLCRKHLHLSGQTDRQVKNMVPCDVPQLPELPVHHPVQVVLLHFPYRYHFLLPYQPTNQLSAAPIMLLRDGDNHGRGVWTPQRGRQQQLKRAHQRVASTYRRDALVLLINQFGGGRLGGVIVSFLLHVAVDLQGHVDHVYGYSL